MNRLGNATSPYLLQHAHNPVPWWEWGDAALAEARLRDCPVLLSVGYAACHWCHVMERESFDDPAIGALMGAHFVNVKVDREERPDVDEVYMRAVQLVQHGHGGWPMTVFLTPDGRPFWGGTYFPPESRHGMPSFRAVLERMARLWREHRSTVETHADEIVSALRRGDRPPEASEPTADMVTDVARGVGSDFDPRNGGFGGAPKFPPHGTLAILVASAARGDALAAERLSQTLQGLTRGGTYDLVEGGFHRYSVDAEWRVPHFEKMLYDQAQLVPVLVDAWLLTGEAAWAAVAEETLDFVRHRLDLPYGGFAASTDADTNGEEGLTFSWTRAELAEVLGADAPAAEELFGVTADGTFEHGRSVLRLRVARNALTAEDLALFTRSRPQLAAERRRRPQPATDDKCVSAWAAVMASAFLRAGLAFCRDELVARARRAAEFLYGPAAPEGRLCRTWRAGRCGPPAFADDVAARGTLALDLFEATGELGWLDRAVADADDLAARFFVDGALQSTPSGGPGHVWTPRNAVGQAEPSALALAALLTTRVAALCGRQDLGAVADALAASRSALARHAPRAVGAEAIAASWRALGGREVVVTGARSAPLRAAIHAVVDPFRVVAWMADGPDARVPASSGRATEAATAWVCSGSTCLPPVRDAAALSVQLRRWLPATPRHRLPALPAASWLFGQPFEDQDREAVAVLCVMSLTQPASVLAVQVLHRLVAQFDRQPVAIAAVLAPRQARERDADVAARGARRLGLHVAVHHDADGRVAAALGARLLPTWVVADPDGAVLWQGTDVDPDTLTAVIANALSGAGTVGRSRAADTVELAGSGLHFPEALAVAGDDLWVADTGAHRVVHARLALGEDGWPVATRIRTYGDRLPGLVDGASPRFWHPRGLAFAAGLLWICDSANHAVRTLDPATGVVATFAGTGAWAASGRVDPARPRDQALRLPWAICGDADALFVGMAGDHRLWVLLPRENRCAPWAGDGRPNSVDGPLAEAGFGAPLALAQANGWLFALDAEAGSLRAVDHDAGRVGTIDLGRLALSHPEGLAVADGVALIADTWAGALRSVDLRSGAATVLHAGLAGPRGLAQWRGICLVAETDHHRIVAVRPDGRMRLLLT